MPVVGHLMQVVGHLMQVVSHLILQSDIYAC